jgi:hypothetical protein
MNFYNQSYPRQFFRGPAFTIRIEKMLSLCYDEHKIGLFVVCPIHQVDTEEGI